MTKKDYKLIAEILLSLRSSMDEPIYELIIKQFSIVLKHNNTLFDAIKFREACLGE